MQGWFEKRYEKTFLNLVLLYCQAQVHDGQHHEHEGLQGDHQNVEDRQRCAQYPLSSPRQQRDQDEDQLAGVHVTEQTQRQRNRFGQQLYHLQCKVGRCQQDGANRATGVERGSEQFFDPAAQALGRDGEADDAEQDGNGQTEGNVHVSRRYHTEVNVMRVGTEEGEADPLGSHRNQVNRQHVHGVHQEHPAEDGECQRSNYVALGVEDFLDLGIDHFDDRFDKQLQFAGVFQLGIACHVGKHASKQEAQDQGNGETVDVQAAEAAFMRRVPECQVVLDVISCVTCHRSISIFNQKPEPVGGSGGYVATKQTRH